MLSGSLLTTFVIWQERTDSLTWINGQQLLNNIAGIIAPLIINPFLSPKYNNNTDIITDNQFFWDEMTVPEQNLAFWMERNIHGTDTNVMYGYLIGGSLTLLSSVILFISYFLMSGILNEETQSTNATTAMGQLSSSTVRCYKHVIIFVILINSFSFGSMIRNYPSFVMVYTVHHLDWSKTESAYLISSMFVTGTVSKILCIFIVRLVRIEIQLFSGAFLAFSGTLLLLFLLETYHFIPWIGTIIFLLGYSNVNAVALGWVDKCLGLKGMLGILWNLGGCSGGIISPFIVGYLYENVSYASFPIFLVACSSFCFVMWLFLQGLARGYKQAVSLVEGPSERDPLINT